MRRSKEISENRYKVLNIKNEPSIVNKFWTWRKEWINNNQELSLFISFIKGIAITILIYEYLNI